MKTEKVEDKIICKIPVYHNKSLQDQLHLLLFLSRPKTRTYEDEPILKAQVKPVSGQIEMEVGLRTRLPCFDRSKGEQIALNVDGAQRNQKTKEDNYFESNVMDRISLKSTECLTDVKSFGVGVMSEGAIHISPLTSMISLKPYFNYLDLVEKRKKLDNKDQVEDMDTEEATKKVTVRFERLENERSRDMKEKSYAFLQKKIREEPWIPVTYNRSGSERSEFESQNLYCSQMHEVVDQCILQNNNYLDHLIPGEEEVEIIKADLPAHEISKAALMALPLQERVKCIIQNVVVASFNELVWSIANKNKSEDHSSILKAIQQYAILVQGNWVMKSDLVYPKEDTSGINVPNEVLQRARDCILYQFTKNTTVNRNSITELINIPAKDLTKVLKGVSKCKGTRGTWEFLLQPDNNFIKKYPDVTQRQKMIWQQRYEQLSQHFIEKK